MLYEGNEDPDHPLHSLPVYRITKYCRYINEQKSPDKMCILICIVDVCIWGKDPLK